MRVLTLAAQKGGAGKTTIATSLAVAAAQEGEVVVVLDLDPQGSLREWSERRTATDIVFRAVEAAGLADLLRRIRQHGRTTLVVVDTPGTLDREVAAVLRESELTLLPVRPSLLDVTATRRTAEHLDQIGRRYAFMINQCQAAAMGRAADAATALVEIGELCPVTIGLRTDFLDAMMLGQGVTEARAGGVAAEEIRNLWAWVKGRL